MKVACVVPAAAGTTRATTARFGTTWFSPVGEYHATRHAELTRAVAERTISSPHGCACVNDCSVRLLQILDGRC